MKVGWKTHLVVTAIATPAAAAASPPVGTISPFSGSLTSTPCDSPEGLAIDLRGNLYTGSSQTKPTGAVCQFSPDGSLKKTFVIPPGPVGVVSLLGMLFEAPHTLLALDFADGFENPSSTDGRVIALDLRTGSVTTLADGFTFPNGIAEDPRGNYYIADSIQGSITRLAPDGSNESMWSKGPLLKAGAGTFPPLGANGVAFDLLFRNMYVSNTGNDQIIRIPLLRDGSVLSPSARLVARHSSTTLMLDNPASLVFVGNQVFFHERLDLRWRPPIGHLRSPGAIVRSAPAVT
jgi:sugar lactone lactonase YvrE